VRRFTDKKVSDETIIELLDVARHAPSNCNTQQWKFIIVDDDELKQKIVDNGGTKLISKSKQGVLVLYDNRTDNIEYMDFIQSASAAIQNFCLYSSSKGIGTCWVCHLPTKNCLRKLFNIPVFYDPIAYVIIGYPLDDQFVVPRKYGINEMVSKNSFDFSYECVNLLWSKRLIRFFYYNLIPVRIKKFMNNFLDNNFVKKFKN